MGPSAQRRMALAAAFVRAAHLYWFVVFPRVRAELTEWRRCARVIPDPALRRIALATQKDERGNLEGAAAFASFVPAGARPHVIRATVAFQAIYDYVDSLVEQPADDPVANGRSLHEALDVALTPGREHPDYYAHHPHSDDGGYLASLVDACRAALGELPAYRLVEHPARRASARMVEYQALIHAPRPLHSTASLRAWASATTPTGTDLRWWETAAAAASSLLVFALMAEAARPNLTIAERDALETAYYPWIGALHVLLDSLIDQRNDADAGHPSLVSNYDAPTAMADRMSWIARSARTHVEALQRPAPHVLLLTAMSCFYLSSEAADDDRARLAAQRITTALGHLARPMLLILRTRRAAARTAAPAPRLKQRRRRRSSATADRDR